MVQISERTSDADCACTSYTLITIKYYVWLDVYVKDVCDRTNDPSDDDETTAPRHNARSLYCN